MRSVYLTPLLLILASIYTNSLSAQIWLEDAAIYEEADEYLDGEEYEEALPLYHLLENKGHANSNLSYKIGKCYLNILGKKRRSIPYLESAIQNITVDYSSSFTETNAPGDANLLLGIAYRVNKDFSKAVEQFNKYKQLHQNSESEVLADYHIKLCNTAQAMIKFPHKSEILPVQSSGNYTQYNPLVTGADEVFYMEKRPFYDAILLAKISSDKIVSSDNISPQIKTDGEHVFLNATADGSKIILKAYDAELGYELYNVSVGEDGNWGKIEKFPSPINSVQNEIFATFSADMNTLYFCSNRDGGYGGADIYTSSINQSGSWSTPENLGDAINSNFDESTVFLSADGDKMFFSSEGHLNMGGNDYFISRKKENGSWGRPVNLGSPVSTPDDDLFLSPTKNKDVFYTYRFGESNNEKQTLFKVVLDEMATVKQTLLNGQLEFNEEIPPKEVTYTIKRGESLLQNSSTDKNGAYQSMLPPGEYEIDYLYNDLVFANQKLSITENLPLDVLSLDAPSWIIKKIENQEKIFITITPILFAFDDYKITTKYHSFLDSIFTILSEHESVKINLIGHTDAIGNSLYNQKLSEKRASEVKDYFISKGLNSDRILVQGMGEKEPVAINANRDGSDNKHGRKYNRRVRINLIVSNDSFAVRFVDKVPDELKIKKE